MTIVFLNPIGRMGGAEAALLDILASLREAEPQWSLHLIVAGDGPLAAKARALGVATDLLPFPDSLARLGDASAGGPAGKSISRLQLSRQLLLTSGDLARYALKLRRRLRKLAPDILHTNGFKMHLMGAIAKPRRVPLIWHIHDYVQARPFMARWISLLHRRCFLILANSDSVKLDIKAVCGDKVSVQTFYNGVDLNNFSPSGNSIDLDSLSGLPPTEQGVLRVGMLATLARWKGHETFLRAISLLPPDLPLRGYVIGGALYATNGSQYSIKELRWLAQELGIADRVGFTGFVDEPAAALRSLDIVVHASTEPEPFGLVIAEGMACGRAVIASKSGGAAEIINAEINALPHPPGDAKRLAERINTLIFDAELRARLGKAGRETVEAFFNRAQTATKLIPIYHAAIAARN